MAEFDKWQEQATDREKFELQVSTMLPVIKRIFAQSPILREWARTPRWLQDPAEFEALVKQDYQEAMAEVAKSEQGEDNGA